MPCGEFDRGGLVDQIDDLQIKGIKDAGALEGTHGRILHKNLARFWTKLAAELESDQALLNALSEIIVEEPFFSG
jgi:hypothetical protein